MGIVINISCYIPMVYIMGTEEVRITLLYIHKVFWEAYTMSFMGCVGLIPGYTWTACYSIMYLHSLGDIALGVMTAPKQANATSSRCMQLCDPIPLWLQLSRRASLPKQFKSSNQMSPTPSGKLNLCTYKETIVKKVKSTLAQSMSKQGDHRN